jgi:hypothetical protein
MFRRMCDQSSRDDDCEECQQWQWLTTGITVAGSLWFINLVLAAFGWATDKSEAVAKFGDAFGVVNALFSSVAVAGAVYAVILQQRELALTRKEMRQARLAHEDSADAQERMAAIQGHSTMLSDLTQEIQYLRVRRDEVGSLLADVEQYHRTFKEGIRTLNLDGTGQTKATELMREAEKLGLWTMSDYASAKVYSAMASDMVDLLNKLRIERSAVVDNLMDAQTAKSHTYAQLKEAMAAKAKATAPV